MKLIEELTRLPGIGERSAQRLAFHILRDSDSGILALSEAVRDVKKGVMECEKCCTLTSKPVCGICLSPARNAELLCVVESPLDLLAIEKTGEYKGLYHVLHGRLSPLDGVQSEDIRLKELFSRLSEDGGVREVILALNSDLESDSTALYIHQKLAEFPSLHVSRIARGIPSGGHLEYTDDATLVRALQGRQSF